MQKVFYCFKKAYKNNPELNAERESINISEQELKISQGNYLPTITLEGVKAKKIQINYKSMVQMLLLQM